MLAAFVLLAILVSTSSAHAQLLGQPIHLDYMYPTIGSFYENDGTQTVTSGGVTFVSLAAQGQSLFTKVTPSKIEITSNIAINFNSASFNGFHLYEVGASPTTISSVTIDSLTNEAGFDASRISFDATNIYINNEALRFDSGINVTLDIGTRSTAVPEPGTFSLFMGTGICSGSLLLRRRRQ